MNPCHVDCHCRQFLAGFGDGALLASSGASPDLLEKRTYRRRTPLMVVVRGVIQTPS